MKFVWAYNTKSYSLTATPYRMSRGARCALRQSENIILPEAAACYYTQLNPLNSPLSKLLWCDYEVKLIRAMPSRFLFLSVAAILVGAVRCVSDKPSPILIGKRLVTCETQNIS